MQQQPWKQEWSAPTKSHHTSSEPSRSALMLRIGNSWRLYLRKYATTKRVPTSCSPRIGTRHLYRHSHERVRTNKFYRAIFSPTIYRASLYHQQRTLRKWSGFQSFFRFQPPSPPRLFFKHHLAADSEPTWGSAHRSLNDASQSKWVFVKWYL